MTAYLMNYTPHNELERTFMFAHVREYALPCGNDRTIAETYCQSLNRAKIEVTLANGRKHICSNFRVENLQPEGFVVSCDVPFAIKTA
jgi:hypothetical protein